MMMTPIQTGIVGCGNIGKQLAHFLCCQPSFRVSTLTDINPHAALALQSSLPYPTCIVPLETAVEKNDLVIECGGRQAAIQLLSSPAADRPGKILLFLSSGALFEVRERLNAIRFATIKIPSGALSGIDAIRAVAGTVESLQLVTTKPAGSLKTAPYVRENNIRLDNLEVPKMIFDGGLDEALRGFPENINVAATLWLASRFNAIHIRIIADPATRLNTHEVTCTGPFGSIQTTTRNLPSLNPKTSQLAVASAQSLLAGLVKPLHVGS